MKVLAIDTSTSAASAALIDNDTLISEVTLYCGKGHSQKLMGIIDQVIQNSGFAIEDIDFFACSEGPGSFTGLRIGASAIKGLAQASDKGVITVSSLSTLAFNMYGFPGIICPLLDAQRDSAYYSMYKWEKWELIQLDDIKVDSIDNIIKSLKQMNDQVIFVGDGALLHRNKLVDSFGELSIAPISHITPRAAACAKLALDKFNNGEIKDYSEVKLNYIRKSQAEVEFEKKVKINIYDMKVEHIDEVCFIQKESFSLPWSRDAYITELENQLSKNIVAEIDGKIVGFGGMWLVFDEAHITNIAVSPKYRGCGIGEKLVDKLIEEAITAKIERMTLEVRETNNAARKMYKKLGFDDLGERKSYYYDTNESAIIMGKELK